MRLRGRPCRTLTADERRAAAAPGSATALDARQREVASTSLDELTERVEVPPPRSGLDYLTLDRQARTLSGGESQRIHLAAALGSGLTGTLYVLDEPTIGLHPRDTSACSRCSATCRRGNTVVVVEHDRRSSAAPTT